MASSGLGSVWALGWLFLTVMVGGESIGTGSSSGKNCGFPAIFNFGDSNSDTGTGSAAFVELLPPYGMSFRKLSKRASDGRLIIDFIAENLGLPYLDGTLDSIGTSFNHGANFATGGAKVSPVVIHGSTIPLHLDIQVSEFLQFKSRTVAQQKQLGNNSNNLPVAEVFPNALYTIDIGQNDVVANVDSSFIPTIIEQFSCSPQVCTFPSRSAVAMGSCVLKETSIKHSLALHAPIRQGTLTGMACTTQRQLTGLLHNSL